MIDLTKVPHLDKRHELAPLLDQRIELKAQLNGVRNQFDRRLEDLEAHYREMCQAAAQEIHAERRAATRIIDARLAVVDAQIIAVGAPAVDWEDEEDHIPLRRLCDMAPMPQRSQTVSPPHMLLLSSSISCHPWKLCSHGPPLPQAQ